MPLKRQEFIEEGMHIVFDAISGSSIEIQGGSKKIFLSMKQMRALKEIFQNTNFIFTEKNIEEVNEELSAEKYNKIVLDSIYDSSKTSSIYCGYDRYTNILAPRVLVDEAANICEDEWPSILDNEDIEESNDKWD